MSTSFKNFLREDADYQASHAYVQFIKHHRDDLARTLRKELNGIWHNAVTTWSSKNRDYDNPPHIVLDANDLYIRRQGQRHHVLLDLLLIFNNVHSNSDLERKILTLSRTVLQRHVNKLNQKLYSGTGRQPFSVVQERSVLGKIGIQYANDDMVWNLFSIQTEKSNSQVRIFLSQPRD